MKGMSFVFGLIMITFLLTIGALMPFFLLKVHIDRLIIYEIKNTDTQLILLSLLSSTHEESGISKPIYEIISEYMALQNTPDEPDIDFLDSMLDELVVTKSYKLYYSENGNEIVLSQSGDPSKYTVKTKIVLPYNSDKLFKQLYLVID